MVKLIISEDTYSVGFSKIRKGDIMNITTQNKNIQAEVVDVYSTQIIISAQSKNYLISLASMSDDNLSFLEDPTGSKTRGTIKGIKSIIITRNGKNISKIYPNNTNNAKNTNKTNKTNKTKTNNIIKPFFKEAYDSILSDLNDLTEGDTVTFSFGELITKNDIKTENKSTMEVYIEKVVKDNLIKCLVNVVEGSLLSNFSNLKGEVIIINKANSFSLSEKGVTLNAKLFKQNKTSDLVSIPNLYKIDNDGKGPVGEVNFDDLMQNQNFKDLMLSKPTFWGKFLNKNPKGVIPLLKALEGGTTNNSLYATAKKYLGNNEYFSKGKKVKLTYLSPKEIDLGGIMLKNGTSYFGVFLDSKRVKLTTSRQNSKIVMELLEKIGDDKYRVKITKENTRDIAIGAVDYGQGIVELKNND